MCGALHQHTLCGLRKRRRTRFQSEWWASIKAEARRAPFAYLLFLTLRVTSMADEPTSDRLLCATSVVDYVKASLRSAASVAPLDVDGTLCATEIVDGNLNFAWRVAEVKDESKAVFVKQAPGYIKCLGEGFALGAERMQVESEVLEEYTATVPELVPRLFVRDDARCAMICEFLSGYELMRTALQEERCPSSTASDIASFMALTHSRTHSCSKPASHWDSWSHLSNDSMCRITVDYVFTKPFDADDPTNRCSEALAAAAADLRADLDVLAAVRSLCDAFLTIKECLVHGDLHTGSIMVPSLAAAGGAGMNAKVIDAEFAHFGCPAFDVGTFLAHLLLAWFASASPDMRTEIMSMVRSSWDTYCTNMQAAVPSPLADAQQALTLLQLTAGFAGCELIRRVVGAAHVPDFEQIAEPERKANAERGALAAGRRLVASCRSMTSFSELLACMPHDANL